MFENKKKKSFHVDSSSIIQLQKSPHKKTQSVEENNGYRTMTISTYTPEADWVEHITKSLKEAGYQKSNRSMVIREAIMCLMDELDGKQPRQVLEYFVDHISKRMKRSSIDEIIGRK
jgi:ubiquinone biosynthesis protein COQ9